MQNIQQTLPKGKTCIICEDSKPLNLFATKINGHLIFLDKCRSCRSDEWEIFQSNKTNTPETYEKRRLAKRAKRLGCPVIVYFSKREVIKRDGLNCYLCNLLLTYEKATIDHIIPLSKGGWHCPSNAKIACLSCNVAKLDKPLEVYLNG